MYNQIFFTNVLRLLDEQHMTKSTFAERVGMSVSFLSDLTNGQANPSLKIMEAIAKTLNTPLPALLEMTDLDRATLALLAGDAAPSTLPAGLVRETAILTDYQAFLVRQWDADNRQRLHTKKHRP